MGHTAWVFRFFDPVVQPLLDATKASVVTEVGSDRGPGTEMLAEWCRHHGAALHVIDPNPKYNVDEWAARWPGVVHFHLDLSLNAIREIPPADVVLIDGDHNWYTVFHELELLASMADEHGRRFPVTLLHDVGWPYGRRDLYYDPESVPDEFRQSHRKGGIVPGQTELNDRGFNDHLHNALQEGTPRNGVLTAVEDFVLAQDGGLELHVIPGLHGLGIVIDSNAEEAVHDAVEEVTRPTGLRRVLEAVEQDRIERLIEVHEERRSKLKVDGGLQAELVRARSELDDLKQRFANLESVHHRLLNRRSVRASLKVASLARPLYRGRSS